MNEKPLNNLDKWLRSLLLTLLGSMAMAIFFSVNGNNFGTDGVAKYIPWTFHTLWQVAVLGFITYVAYRMCVTYRMLFNSDNDYFKNTMVCVFAFSMLSLPGMIIYAFILDGLPSNKLIEPQYYGITSHFSFDAKKGKLIEKDEYAFDVAVGFLYRKDNPELERAFREESKYNEYVGTRGYLFWQTGLADGFYPLHEGGVFPLGFPKLPGDHGWLKRIKLFFTVGPMAIVEGFIRGMIDFFPILMGAQVIWFLVRKKQCWWDYKSEGRRGN